jgi:hypothetical protein
VVRKSPSAAPAYIQNPAVVTYAYSALPDVYGPLHLIPKAQCTRLKSWRVWQNYREWVQKNEYEKIKSVFITFKFILFFPVISHFDEVLIVFQKNKKKSE